MGSEILCQFLLGNNEGILERQFGYKMFFVHTIRKQMLKFLLIYQLVELNLLYKIHYFTFFLSLKKVPSFSFFSMTLILRKAPF